jgi:transposase
MIDESAIRLRYDALQPVLDEPGRRRFAAAEARAAGFGGVTVVARVTGIARSTIRRGIVELRDAVALPTGRKRRPGAGRKPLIESDASLLDDLRGLVEPVTRGDPEAPLLWTAKSLRNLAAGLRELGHGISHSSVRTLLQTLGYSLQANHKTREGASHPDRDAQFGYINDQVKAALAAGEPVISVDTKKKELVGDFKNGGREGHPGQ